LGKEFFFTKPASKLVQKYAGRLVHLHAIGMARILAFDYGIKRTGLAVTDPLQMIATPIGTQDTAVLADWLKKYLAGEDVELFVVGLPSRFSGEDTHATQPVLQFIEKLGTMYPNIPVTTIDERLSSREARHSILANGHKKSKRRDKKLVDTVSATLILQTYLQSRL
jgi:putative Holliday junction resolvase